MSCVSDFRLNPQLKKSCQMDIPKFCSEILHNSKQDEELEGKVINCLKKQFVRRVSFFKTETKKKSHNLYSKYLMLIMHFRMLCFYFHACNIKSKRNPLVFVITKSEISILAD